MKTSAMGEIRHAPLDRRLGLHVLAQHHHSPGTWRQDPRHHAEERRLPCPVRSRDDVKAGGDGQRDLVQHRRTIVARGELRDLHHAPAAVGSLLSPLHDEQRPSDGHLRQPALTSSWFPVHGDWSHQVDSPRAGVPVILPSTGGRDPEVTRVASSRFPGRNPLAPPPAPARRPPPARPLRRAWDLCSFLPGLSQTDGDGLPAALHLPAAPAAEPSALVFAHCLFHSLLGFRPVPCHGILHCSVVTPEDVFPLTARRRLQQARRRMTTIPEQTRQVAHRQIQGAGAVRPSRPRPGGGP